MIEAVLARSDRNPFLAEELVAADALAGVLPEGLRNLLLARTAELSPAARQVVGLAAVAGVAIDDDLLGQVWLAAYGQETALPEALRRAVAAGVLVGVAGQRRYAFRHAMVREAIYDDLLPTDRSHWHRELARCLERAPRGVVAYGPAASSPGAVDPVQRAAVLVPRASGTTSWLRYAGTEVCERQGSPGLVTRMMGAFIRVTDRLANATQIGPTMGWRGRFRRPAPPPGRGP